MKPQKMKAYASFAEWKRDQSAAHQRLIGSLARLVKQIAPDFTTSVKWGQGCWTLQGTPKVYIHAEPDHLQLGFYAGSTLRDPDGLLEGKGKFIRFVKLRATSRVPRTAITALLRQLL